ncbi:MAG TPA: YdcF family protein [Niallia sp.]|nr:YdcF family protein [Niallia sp.]
MKFGLKKIIFLMFFFLLLFTVLLLNAGTLLAGFDKPSKADAIIILSGDNGRLEKGVYLFNEGYAEKLILSNSNYLDVKKNKIIEKVPKSAIFHENKAVNTYSNAVYTKEIMKENRLNSAIVVTSNYHMLRSKYIFERVYNDTSIKLFYSTSDVKGYNPNWWWLNEVGRDLVTTEYLKLLRYFIIY